MTLKTRMTVTVTLLVAAVVALVAGSSLRFFTSQLRNAVSDHQYSLVTALAGQLDLQLATARAMIEAEAGTVQRHLGGPAEELHEGLMHHQEALEFFDAGIAFFALDGTILASTWKSTEVESPICPSPRAADLAGSRSLAPLVKAFFCQVGEHPAAFFPAPVLDRNGTPVGVLAGGIKLAGNNFLAQLGTIKFGQNGFLYLFSADGTLIVHPDRTLQLKKQEGMPGRSLQEVPTESEGSREAVSIQGIEVLNSFKRLRQEDWILAAEYPIAEAYAPILRAQRYFLPGVAGVLFLGGCLVWWSMRRLSTPLTELTGFARDLIAGRNSDQPPIRRHDEIGLFAETFQHLLEQMRSHEGAIQSQVEFLQTLIDTMPNPVFYKDADGIYLGCNRAFESYIGRSRQDLVGKSVFDLAPHDLAQVYHHADLDLFANGGDQVYEAKVKYADGNRRDVIFYKAVFRNSDGSLGGLIGTFLDITERKEAEAALQDQMEFSDSLLWNSGAPTFVIDAERRIVAWNRACELLTGKTAGQMIGTTNHWQAFYPTPRPCLADLVIAPETAYPGAEMGYSGLRRSDLAQDGLQAEGWFPDLNGRERYICFNAAPIRNSKGQVIAAVETLEDITDRQKRHQELEVFSQVTTALRGARNRVEIQAIVLDHALELSRARAAVLLFLEGPGNRLVVEQARGAWAELAGMELDRDQGIARVALESRLPEVHPIEMTDPRLVRTDLMVGLANLICIPLIAHDLPIGVMCLGFPGEIPDHERRQLTVVGEIAASALHRSQLHEQTERQLQRLLALRSIDLAITSSLDLRLTLKVFLEQVCSQLKVDAADIFLCRPEKGVCEFAAGRGYLPPLENARSVSLNESWFGKVVQDGRLLTVKDLAESEDPRGTELAAKEGFAFCVILPLVAQGRVQGMLEVFHRSPLAPNPEWYEFLDALGTQAAIAIVKSTLFENLQRSNSRLLLAYDTTIEGWSRALDMRDKETEGHSVRVTEMTLRLARSMNFPEDQLVHLRWGALLHDIGKMGVPDRILLKEGELTPEEWAIMRQHPRFGYDLLSPIEHLRSALDIPYCHHEKWDGTGYPRGLKGEQIPLSARIFAVVDVWDALRSTRPYRAGWQRGKILDYLRNQAGTRFDPAVVAAFLRLEL